MNFEPGLALRTRRIGAGSVSLPLVDNFALLTSTVGMEMNAPMNFGRENCLRVLDPLDSEVGPGPPARARSFDLFGREAGAAEAEHDPLVAGAHALAALVAVGDGVAFAADAAAALGRGGLRRRGDLEAPFVGLLHPFL